MWSYVVNGVKRRFGTLFRNVSDVESKPLHEGEPLKDDSFDKAELKKW